MLPVIGDFPGRKPEAARFFVKAIGTKTVIPSHYGCFVNRTIEPQCFADLFKYDADMRPAIIEHKEIYPQVQELIVALR